MWITTTSCVLCMCVRFIEPFTSIPTPCSCTFSITKNQWTLLDSTRLSYSMHTLTQMTYREKNNIVCKTMCTLHTGSLVYIYASHRYFSPSIAGVYKREWTRWKGEITVRIKRWSLFYFFLRIFFFDEADPMSWFPMRWRFILKFDAMRCDF